MKKKKFRMKTAIHELIMQARKQTLEPAEIVCGFPVTLYP